MNNMDKWAKSVELTVSILKKRFPNLTVEEVLKIAHEIARGIVNLHQY